MTVHGHVVVKLRVITVAPAAPITGGLRVHVLWRYALLVVVAVVVEVVVVVLVVVVVVVVVVEVVVAVAVAVAVAVEIVVAAAAVVEVVVVELVVAAEVIRTVVVVEGVEVVVVGSSINSSRSSSSSSTSSSSSSSSSSSTRTSSSSSSSSSGNSDRYSRCFHDGNSYSLGRVVHAENRIQSYMTDEGRSYTFQSDRRLRATIPKTSFHVTCIQSGHGNGNNNGNSVPERPEPPESVGSENPDVQNTEAKRGVTRRYCYLLFLHKNRRCDMYVNTDSKSMFACLTKKI